MPLSTIYLICTITLGAKCQITQNTEAAGGLTHCLRVQSLSSVYTHVLLWAKDSISYITFSYLPLSPYFCAEATHMHKGPLGLSSCPDEGGPRLTLGAVPRTQGPPGHPDWTSSPAPFSDAFCPGYPTQNGQDTTLVSIRSFWKCKASTTLLLLTNTTLGVSSAPDKVPPKSSPSMRKYFRGFRITVKMFAISCQGHF